jgi:hypothetical protein
MYDWQNYMRIKISSILTMNEIKDVQRLLLAKKKRNIWVD